MLFCNALFLGSLNTNIVFRGSKPLPNDRLLYKIEQRQLFISCYLLLIDNFRTESAAHYVHLWHRK